MDPANAAHITPADRIIGALAFASGSADVFALLKFHDVFTSAMTGNTALFGLALGQGHLLAATRSMTALLGFSLGSVSGTVLNDLGPDATRLRRLIGAEIAGLVIVALLWAIMPHPLRHAPLYFMILIAAWSMGVQSIAARAIDLPGIPTVVFTTTLSIIMMTLTRKIFKTVAKETVKPITLRQISAMLIYVVGAAISGLLAMVWPGAIAIPAVVSATYAFWWASG